MAAGVRDKRWLAAVAIAFVSCHGVQQKTIAVIPKGTAHLFWLSVEAGAVAAGKNLGVRVLWTGPAQETEYDRQIQIVDSMIARHVDGMAIAAAEKTALVHSIDRASASGIPVTVFDSGVDTDHYVSFIATNNYQAGKMAARELARLLNQKGKIAVLMHTPGSASTMERENGFYETIAKEFPGIRVVARQYGMSDRSKAMAAAEDMLTANPGLDGMFASAEPSSVGAALAVKTRGLTGRIKLVAFDSTDSLIQDLRNGVINSLVVQDPFEMGYKAVATLVDKFNGKTPPKRIDVPAYIVRKDDLDKPDVKQLLNPALRKS
jgi:ribose transport system substrate-binding protein